MQIHQLLHLGNHTIGINVKKHIILFALSKSQLICTNLFYVIIR